MGLMRRAIIHGIETTNNDQERPTTTGGAGTDADDYIMDFDINTLSENGEQKLRLSLQAANGGVPLLHSHQQGHSHHHQQQGSAGAGNGGAAGGNLVSHAHQQQIHNGAAAAAAAGHMMEELPPAGRNTAEGANNGGGGGGGGASNQHLPGMGMYSNLNIPSRQQQHHLIQVKTLQNTPPATPPEGSPTQYHTTSSPQFHRVPPIGAHTPQLDPHEIGRVGLEEIGMWNQPGGGGPVGPTATDASYMNHEAIPINLSSTGGMENMWIPKQEHQQLIHNGGVGSPQPYIPHAHGPPHHAHMHAHSHHLPHHHHHHPHHAHQRSHTRSQSLESKDSSSYSSSNGSTSGGGGGQPGGPPSHPLTIPDEILTNKPVRELNKLLHGFPRELITKVKQKRRTLKNRGYAQNCRTKRLHQKNLLEDQNKKLQKEINKLTQERDMWKSKAMQLDRRFQHNLDIAAAVAHGNSNGNVSIAAAAAAAAAAAQQSGNNHNGPIHPGSGGSGGGNPAHLHHGNGQLPTNQQQQHPLPSINVPPATSTTNGNGNNNGNGIYSTETSTNSSPDSSYY